MYVFSFLPRSHSQPPPKQTLKQKQEEEGEMEAEHRRWLLLFLTLVLQSAVTLPNSYATTLTLNYYQNICPNLSQIVQNTVIDKQIKNPTTAAGTVRLFFHDCFLQGCDASLLITSTPFNKAERDADINLSLPGDAFDVVIRAKTAVELECPGVVSCSDILALATRDLLTMVGGPYYNVLLGRRDALSSKASTVEGNLPRPTMSISQILSIFASKGFTLEEMVALSGAHTIGFSHCNEFSSRIYNYSPKSQTDPTMNPRYAEGLRKACAGYGSNPTIAAFNDLMTPNKFDNSYYQNIPRGLGLLASDQAMISEPRMKPLVELFAANQTAFFKAFATAIEKLSVFGVKTGRRGEVRRRCDQFNSL